MRLPFGSAGIVGARPGAGTRRPAPGARSSGLVADRYALRRSTRAPRPPASDKRPERPISGSGLAVAGMRVVPVSAVRVVPVSAAIAPVVLGGAVVAEVSRGVVRVVVVAGVRVVLVDVALDGMSAWLPVASGC